MLYVDPPIPYIPEEIIPENIEIIPENIVDDVDLEDTNLSFSEKVTNFFGYISSKFGARY
jgi:hypothetical protein